MAFFNKTIALFLFLTALLTGSVVKASVPSADEIIYDDTVMFFSDYQGNENMMNFDELLSAAKEEKPGLVVGGGDYQSTFAGTLGSAFGIHSARKSIAKTWDYNLPVLFTQGNHDMPMSAYLNKSGLYTFDKYHIYIINEDNFPWMQYNLGYKEDTVKETAKNLDNALSALTANGDTRPVFVVSHVPLHYTERRNGTDNTYAGLIVDVLNRNAENLNIVFLFGHNHSGTYDDYVGGAVNYIPKGSSIFVGGSKKEVTLNFTYTNCGYVGYSDNTDNDNSTSELTVTFAKIKDNGIDIVKYSKSGVYRTYTIDFENSLSLAA